jgi:hypothetical protein
MSKSGYYNQGRILKEGECHDFRYVKNVTLEDNNKYMIMEDQNGYRYFIEASYYEKYSLTPASVVKCYVDKINCTGRIFLEPEHPVYKRGEVYEFDIHSVNDNEKGKVVKVSDCYGNIIEVKGLMNSGDNNLLPTRIKGTVDKVKKGIPEILIKGT